MEIQKYKWSKNMSKFNECVKRLKVKYSVRDAARHNNLVFDGFPEQCNETDMDCYNLVCDALSHLFSDDNTPGGQSKIDKANNITINRAHRNGRFIPGRNRSIIINLQWYGDKEYIISNR